MLRIAIRHAIGCVAGRARGALPVGREREWRDRAILKHKGVIKSKK